MIEKLFAPYAGLGELILRIALGVTFFAHGQGKVKNPADFAGFLKQIRVPVPLLSAWLVALLETVGAVLLILGIGTRVLSLGLAIDMLVALLTVRIGKAPFTSGAQGTDGILSSCSLRALSRLSSPGPAGSRWTDSLDSDGALLGVDGC